MVWDQDEDRPFSEKRIDSRTGIQLVIYAMYINKLKVQILALLPAKLLLETSPMPHRLYPSHTMYYIIILHNLYIIFNIKRQVNAYNIGYQ